MSVILTLPISAIIRDPRLQMRVRGVNPAIVEEYAENIFDLPPVKGVKGETGEIWLVDGNHTLDAYVKMGQDTIRIELTDGTYLDALAQAAGANHSHGLRRTDQDKRHSVRSLLEIDLWEHRSNEAIARQCRVSAHLVKKVRDQFDAEKTSEEPKKKSKKAKEPKTRTDTRGREQPATRTKPRCERCVRVCPDGVSIDDCAACADLQSRKPKTTEPKTWKDDAGQVVPTHLIPVFEMVPVYKEAATNLRRLASFFKAIENSAADAGKPIDSRHFTKFSVVVKRAEERARDLRPSIVHQRCGADGCAICTNLGWLTVERAKAERETI